MKLGLKYNSGERRLRRQAEQERDNRLEQEFQAEIGRLALLFDWPQLVHFRDGRPDDTARLAASFPDRYIFELENGGFISDLSTEYDSDKPRPELR